MRGSSLENLQRCVDLTLGSGSLARRAEVAVLDLGSLGGDGGHRELFDGLPVRYIGAGLSPTRGVDLAPDGPHSIPPADGSVDIVISDQRPDDFGDFRRAVAEMVRVVAADGFIFLITPSVGHDDPPDAYAALATLTRCHLLRRWLDERGPSHDLVGIFSKTAQPLPPRPIRRRAPVLPRPPVAADPALERASGQMPYLELLAWIHAMIEPELYLEIGVRYGRSLSLARCPAIAIDPAPDLRVPVGAVTMFQMTSDDFFAFDADGALRERGPDLVFIDGLHLFEHALRDFMNVERHAHPATVVVIDDVSPNHVAQAERTRRTQVWSGDVWKLADCLRRYRPELEMLLVDAYPTGLLVVAGLDSADRTLWERYDTIVSEYEGPEDGAPPAAVIEREGAIGPSDGRLAQLLASVRASRGAADHI